ncbi:MAG: hypothetical protein ACJAR9_001867 [Celeribacter sp.]|jgi:hypothetical protein
MAIDISGHMIGRFASAHLTGPCATRSLIVVGIDILGTADDRFTLNIEQNHNGQHIWRVLNEAGDVIKGDLVPDPRSFDGLGAGETHILFMGGFILDLTGFDSNSRTYVHETLTATQPGHAPIVPDATDPMCFAAGSVVRCKDGLQPVETVTTGDLVWTADQGYQPVEWVAATHVNLSEKPDLAPVEILRGALGPKIPERPVLVSPEHRVLMTGHRLELYAGLEEALVPARLLVDGKTIRHRTDLKEVMYFHLMFSHHEIVDSGGLLAESYHPEAVSLGALGKDQRDALYLQYPHLRLFGDHAAGPLVRPKMRGHAAAVLLRAA